MRRVSGASNVALDLAEPTCFALDYDPAMDRVLLARIDSDVIAQSSFLDGRTPLSSGPAQSVSVADCIPKQHAPAMLFHTAFCGSTLLARALQAPPAVMSLREPSALLALAMASLKPDIVPPAQVERAARVVLGLLGRPWVVGGRVLIKPTNQVNRILPLLLRISPQSRVLLLHSSLEQFLMSCLKKLPAAEQQVRWMAQALLPGTQLALRLDIPLTHPFNLVESAVLTWYAQMEIYALALSADPDNRLCSIDIDTLLAAPTRSVAAAADHLRLPAAHEGLEARVIETFSRNAKAQDRAFDSTQRERENALMQQRYGDVIQQAMQWAERVIAPAATLPSMWKPLLSLMP